MIIELQQVSVREIRGPILVPLGTVGQDDLDRVNAIVRPKTGYSVPRYDGLKLNLTNEQFHYIYQQKRLFYEKKRGKKTLVGGEIRTKTDIHHHFAPHWAWALTKHPKPVNGVVVEPGKWSAWRRL